ncbi:hypothetical protein SKAU_G00207930 [Synaphobranchus kaupii]|uniref:DDE Tnp4 domain-containing protein n=1 Tax=Synaphobranchus kaupii TaxID=118154 RepID=A0A9Q1F8U5_SYNKA|nr:hypothetical protein SKAU_G00207930 [Synaphobranchus kaupii]
MLNESGLKQLFERHFVPQGCDLFGHKGYPLRRAHHITRSVVERGIGQWKRRFHILHSEIRYSPERVCRIIMACAILHNICKRRNIPPPPEDDYDDNDGGAGDASPPSNINPCDGAAFRQHFANLHFGYA